MFSFQSPHQGNSSEYKKYTIFNIKKKIILNYPKSSALRFSSKGLKTEFDVNRGKRAISVLATEGLLYFSYISKNIQKYKAVNIKNISEMACLLAPVMTSTTISK